MKSLLVDAMRQANKGDNDSTLSDSGSFDTTSDQFSETANDAVVTAPETIGEDLQLLDHVAPVSDTTGIEALQDDATTVLEPLTEPEPTEPASGRELSAADSAMSDVAAPAAGKASLLSNWSPAICLALFLVTGLAWTVWQSWHFHVAGSALGATRIPGESPRLGAGEAGAASHMERFPFITAAESAASEETEE